MNHFLLHFNSGHWFGVAMLLFIVEVLTGTGFLLWMGMSAIVISVLLLMIPSVSMELQFIIFSISSLLTACGWRIYLQHYPTKTDKPKLNKRAEQYIGRTFTLESPIINGMGKVHVDDSMWRLQCDDDLPVGTSIYISDADGVILIAKRCKEPSH